MGVDVAFLPGVAVCLARPLLKVRQRRNYVFVPLLLVMATGNLLMHLPVLGAPARLSPVGRDLGLYMILVAVVIVGGRVIPFFTGRALAGTDPRMRKPVEVLAVASVLLVAVAEVARLPASARMIAGLLAFVVHLVRWWGWQSRGVWKTPLLWILHIAYAWLVLGFALTAIVAQGALPPSIPQHAFTVGGFSVMILGMISRVSLGHTGRPLKPNPVVVLAFFLINAAAVVRVLLPIPAMDRYLLWINLSGILWALAFALFAIVYTPILTRPRPDGKHG
jgi:uncharacterized protein involved in response to NO